MARLVKYPLYVLLLAAGVVATLAGAIIWLCYRLITGESPDVFPIIRVEPASISDPGTDNPGPTKAKHNTAGERIVHRIGGQRVLGHSRTMEEILDEYDDSF